jgi:tetratricopeptide (TPR) repeat protein
MPGIKMGTLRRSKIKALAGFLVLAMLLPVLGGCATGPKEQAMDIRAPVVAGEPSRELSQEISPQELSMAPAVARLNDGREGFIITEVPPMDEALGQDFDDAVALLKREDYDEAIVLLEKVIEKSPGVTAPYVDIAIAYRRTGRPEQAEENLKRALELFPGHPVACNELGLLYRETGRFTEARSMYEMAIARFPQFYPARRNLGIVCDLYLSDLACALEHYEKYSEAKPHDEQVKLWVADLRARLGRDQGER